MAHQIICPNEIDMFVLVQKYLHDTNMEKLPVKNYGELQRAGKIDREEYLFYMDNLSQLWIMASDYYDLFED